MRTFDEVILAIVTRTQLVLKSAPPQQRPRVIRDRIEQLHGVVELARWFQYDFFAERILTHIKVLERELEQS